MVYFVPFVSSVLTILFLFLQEYGDFMSFFYFILFLGGVIILYAAVYAHYKPLANLASITIGLKLIFILAETFIFASIGVGQNLIFPLVTGTVGLLVTLGLPYIVDGCSVFGDFDCNDDENNDLVKQARRLRKTKKS